jgi:hypothetical protein
MSPFPYYARRGRLEPPQGTRMLFVSVLEDFDLGLAVPKRLGPHEVEPESYDLAFLVVEVDIADVGFLARSTVAGVPPLGDLAQGVVGRSTVGFSRGGPFEDAGF